MDIKQIATQLLMKNIGGGSDPHVAESALDDLIGNGKKFDIVSMVGQFTGKGGDVAEMAKSWLGDGANESISASQLQDVIGQDKVAAFADKLGVSREDAGDSLAKFLPQLVDKSSRGGNLLDSVGGAGGLAKLASKFFK